MTLTPNSNWRLAVASRSFSRHPVLRGELLARYPNTTFNDQGLSLSGNDLVDFLQDHDMAITALEPITENVVSRLPRLKILSKYGVGIDMIDLGALRRHGIRLGWHGGVNCRSVSELAIAATISLLRHVSVGDRHVRSGGWQQFVGRQLTGKTVGIIGLGHVGRDLVRLLQPFRCEVLANDVVDITDYCGAHGVESCGLSDLLARSDVVSLHVPLDTSTLNLIGSGELALMKPDAILVNMARGGIVDEQALADALIGKKLGGAALDVFHQEPPVDGPLMRLDNVLLTPHIGGSAAEAILAMGRAAIAGLEAAKEANPEHFR